MINESNILICSSSSGSPSDPDRIAAISPMVSSSTKHGINVQIFWTNQPFDSYFNSKLKNLHTNLQSVDPIYTHVLYVDSHDILFISTLSEILQSYDALGDPNFLILGDSQQDLADANMDLNLNLNSTGYRFPNDGCFIGRINTINNVLSTIINRVGDNIYIKPRTIFRNLLSEGILQPSHIDSNCNIFQSLIDTSYSELGLENGSIKNLTTNTFPKIIHADNSMHQPSFQRLYNFVINDDSTGLSTAPDNLIGIKGTSALKNNNNGMSYINWDLGDPRSMILLTKNQINKILTRSLDLINVIRTSNNNNFIRSWLTDESPNIRFNINIGATTESFIIPNTIDALVCQALIEYDTVNNTTTKITLRYFDINRTLLHSISRNIIIPVNQSDRYIRNRTKGVIV